MRIYKLLSLPASLPPPLPLRIMFFETLVFLSLCLFILVLHPLLPRGQTMRNLLQATQQKLSSQQRLQMIWSSRIWGSGSRRGTEIGLELDGRQMQSETAFVAARRPFIYFAHFYISPQLMQAALPCVTAQQQIRSGFALILDVDLKSVCNCGDNCWKGAFSSFPAMDGQWHANKPISCNCFA